MTDKTDPLAKMREPFAPSHISKLPKPTKVQTDAVKADFKKGIRCKLCGAWHHPDVVHLDYVGHAALTDRLLDTDPHWSWEPAAFTEQGLPAFDQSGGLWIKLTVCGVTRLGYGHAAAKQTQDPGAREKEVIGDALRNAAMRFGAALDLWHKGQLHATDTGDDAPETVITKAQLKAIEEKAVAAGVSPTKICTEYHIAAVSDLPASAYPDLIGRLDAAIAKKMPAKGNEAFGELGNDEIPY